MIAKRKELSCELCKYNFIELKNMISLVERAHKMSNPGIFKNVPHQDT